MARSGMTSDSKVKVKILESGYMACKANVHILHTDCLRFLNIKTIFGLLILSSSTFTFGSKVKVEILKLCLNGL